MIGRLFTARKIASRLPRLSRGRADGAPPIAVARAADGHATFDGELKAHVRMNHRVGADSVLDHADLGGIRLEELQPCRHIGEKIPDLDRHARHKRPRALLDDLAGADPEPGAGAQALDVGHRSDARERLAAETETRDCIEVFEAGDLAGRVAPERERQLLGGNAAAVVADPDRRPARAANIDADAAGTGVERVLHELLDDRRRPLDHLAGGDRVRDLRLEEMNRAHWFVAFDRSS